MAPVTRNMLILSAFFLPLLVGFLGTSCEPPPDEMCEKAANLTASALVRCGSGRTYEEERVSIINALAYGSCKTIKKIRDSKSLIEDCLPWLENVNCDILLSGKWLPACLGQFLVGDPAKEQL